LADFVEKFYNPEVVSARRGTGVNDLCSWGFTFPTFAISRNHINEGIFDLFHRAGADLREKDGQNKTPYEWLIEKSCIEEAITLEKVMNRIPYVVAMPPQKPDYAKAHYLIDIAG
jgi:hypothetical protein